MGRWYSDQVGVSWLFLDFPYWKLKLLTTQIFFRKFWKSTKRIRHIPGEGLNNILFYFKNTIYYSIYCVLKPSKMSVVSIWDYNLTESLGRAGCWVGGGWGEGGEAGGGWRVGTYRVPATLFGPPGVPSLYTSVPVGIKMWKYAGLIRQRSDWKQ